MFLVEPGTLVFIVDDEVLVRDSVADLLAMEGYEPRPLSSADAAWRELGDGPGPAAIILDLWLYGMTSGEFVRRLRASRHACTPLLVLSAWRDLTRVEFDADAVSEKPIEGTALVRALDKLVRLGPRRASATDVGRQSAERPPASKRLRGRRPAPR